MESAKSVLMMALIIRSAMGDNFLIKSRQGLVLFLEKGTLIFETEHSILVFHIDCRCHGRVAEVKGAHQQDGQQQASLMGRGHGP
jgi:hypothetical protein